MNPKVFSYRRFSSGRQAKGTSIARQAKLAQEWCQAQGLTLDESLCLADLGLSAYHGDNKTRGELGAFLRAIEEGKVPRGSYLVVEALDRLTRAKVLEAMNLLAQIVHAGVKVVSLNDGMIWDEEKIANTSSLLISVVMFSRAHDESRIKAQRVSAAFQLKRNSGIPVVSNIHGGGWVLPKEDRTGWELVPEKAESVKKVFELVSEGYGGVRIARIANQEKWVMPWRKRTTTSETWEHTGISRLLRDRRVLGEWQPKRMINGKYVPDGDPVPNYFPSVVDEQLWFRAQNALIGRQMPKRLHGKHSDIFAGLFSCACGSKMERKAPSGRGNPIYYCVKRKAGLSDCRSFREEGIIETFFALAGRWKRLHFVGSADKTREEISLLQSKLTEVKKRIDNLAGALEELGSSNTLLQRLRQAELDEKRLMEKLEDARGRIVTIDGDDPIYASSNILKNVHAAVSNPEATDERYKLQRSLQSFVDWMSISYYEDDPDPHLTVKMRQGDQAAITRFSEKYLVKAKRKTKSKATN